MIIVHVADYVMPQMGYQDFMLAKWNARHGHDVHMVTSDRYTPVPDYNNTWEPLLGTRVIGTGLEQHVGVNVHRLRCLLEVKRRVWLAGLGGKIEDIRPDVVFCHGTSSPLAFALPAICKRLRIPLLMDNHQIFDAQRRGLTGRLYYLALVALTRWKLNGSVHQFLGVEQECSDFMIQEQGIPREKVDRLELGVDTDIFRPDDSAGRTARAEYGVPPNATVVVQTGKLTRDKGPHWLTEAMAPIMKQNSNIWLLMVGGAPADFIGEVTAPIYQENVIDQFKMVPLVSAEKMAGVMNLADVYVYPDASSLSCLEAAACGRSCIVTDLPAGKAREEAGLAVSYQRGNVEHLRGMISNLISSPSARKKIGDKARSSVVEGFSYDAIAGRLEIMLRQAVDVYGTTNAC